MSEVTTPASPPAKTPPLWTWVLAMAIAWPLGGIVLVIAVVLSAIVYERSKALAVAVVVIGFVASLFVGSALRSYMNKLDTESPRTTQTSSLPRVLTPSGAYLIQPPTRVPWQEPAEQPPPGFEHVKPDPAEVWANSVALWVSRNPDFATSATNVQVMQKALDDVDRETGGRLAPLDLFKYASFRASKATGRIVTGEL